MRMTEDLIDDLIEKMPSGSGIDCDYSWTKSNGKLILHNSFHNMNDGGYYDGYSEFKVYLILKDDGVWILDKIRFAKSITDPSTYRKYSNYLLRDYLYDTYSWSIEELSLKLVDLNEAMVDFQ